MRRLGIVLCAVGLAGCAGSASRLPDYSEWLHAGVDPAVEAQALLDGFERAGYAQVSRLDGAGWEAFDVRRGPIRAVRVVTSRGAALVLDSHEPDGVRPRHGAIVLARPAAPGAFDVDRDGRDEVVVGAESEGRVCLLPCRVEDDGAVTPHPADVADLGPDACVEDLRDVDGHPGPEAIVVLRAEPLRRMRVPRVEVPLAFGDDGRARAGSTPLHLLEAARRANEAALDAARRAPDPDEVFSLAVERALLARAAGATPSAQREAFDEAIARSVVPPAMIEDIGRARTWLEATRVNAPAPPRAP